MRIAEVTTTTEQEDSITSTDTINFSSFCKVAFPTCCASYFAVNESCKIHVRVPLSRIQNPNGLPSLEKLKNEIIATNFLPENDPYFLLSYNNEDGDLFLLTSDEALSDILIGATEGRYTINVMLKKQSEKELENKITVEPNAHPEHVEKREEDQCNHKQQEFENKVAKEIKDLQKQIDEQRSIIKHLEKDFKQSKELQEKESKRIIQLEKGRNEQDVQIKQLKKSFTDHMTKLVQEKLIKEQELEKKGRLQKGSTNKSMPWSEPQKNLQICKSLIMSQFRYLRKLSFKLQLFEPITSRTLNGHTGAVRCLKVLPNGHVLTGSDDNTIKIWDIKGNFRKTLYGHTSTVNDLQILPNGDLASASRDWMIMIWDLKNETFRKTLEGHSGDVFTLQMLPNGDLASGSQDKTIKIWNLEYGICLKTLTGHSKWVRCLQIWPGGDLASGSGDSTINIWNIAKGNCKKTLRGHTGPVVCLQKLPTGDLVSGSEDNSIKIWDLKNFSCRQTLSNCAVRCLQILPTGDFAGGSFDAIKIWDLKSGACKKTLTGHTGWVVCLQILPNGDLVSSSSDKAWKIWKFSDAELEELLARAEVSLGVSILTCTAW